MIDWQLVRLPLATVFPLVVIRVNERAKMSNAARMEALNHCWYANLLYQQLKEYVYWHLNIALILSFIISDYPNMISPKKSICI